MNTTDFKNITHMTRNHHLTHMTKVLPILAIIFVAQCFIIPQSFPELQLGNLYFVMSVFLCCGVSALYLYDTQIHIFIKDGMLYWQIPKLKISKSYCLIDLKTIEAFDVDQPFSNLRLAFGAKNKIINLYFIDNPAQMIQKLWQSKVEALNALKVEEVQNQEAA